jgi:hypothetical protein
LKKKKTPFIFFSFKCISVFSYSQGSANHEPDKAKLKNSTNSFEKVVLTPYFLLKKKIRFNDIEPSWNVVSKDLKSKNQLTLNFV